MGLGQLANKTNGSPSNARGLERKLFRGTPANSNLAKRLQKKENKKRKKVRVFFLSWRASQL